MNEYLIQKETLTGLADEIRVLSGETEAMSTDAMTNSVADANDEVDSQAIQIAEISALLEGKGVPGSSEGIAIETCTVTLNTSASGESYGNLAYIAYENGDLVLKTFYGVPSLAIGVIHSTIECVKNTNIILGLSTTATTSANRFLTDGNIKFIEYDGFTLGASFKVTGNGSITWTA